MVVVGYRGDEVESLVRGKCSKVVWNYDYEKSDMFKSIKIGLESLRGVQGVFIVPGDMPLISKETFENLIKAMEVTNGKVIIPIIDNRPKHPPLIHINCIKEILEYKGNNGLRGALSELNDYTHYVQVNDVGCTMDADTSEEYERIKLYYEEFILEEKRR